MRRICVFTGTRADYGLLRPVMEAIRSHPDLVLQLIAGGMHLSPEFGLTCREIEDDGFSVDARAEFLLSSDTPTGTCKSTGLALLSLGEAFERLGPDLLVVLGDRFEALAAATAALLQRIPIAHIHGGETTEGAMDEAIRHAITKMSLLHFASTEEYRRRIIQLGEAPGRVFNVGALGVENIERTPLLCREELETELGFTFGAANLLVTFHPATLERQSAEPHFRQLLLALDRLAPAKIIFTKANADTEGRAINALIDRYVSEHPERTLSATSLGHRRYLSVMRQVDAVVGNSSSGIIEAPALGVPTVNIGDRQKGRVKAPSVIDCPAVEEEIYAACNRILTKGLKKEQVMAENPYRQPETSRRIVEAISSADLTDLKKTFFDLPANCFGGLP